MQRSLYAAVSGLRNEQTRMDVIGNNIANVNTTAFKAGRATFEESFSQVLQGATRPTDGQAGSDAITVGLGMKLASVDTVFTQGNFETTGKTTDLAIQGSSFFVVAKNGSQSFTRAGNFKVDGQGYLAVSEGGSIVQGRMATDGVLGSAITDIKLPYGQTTPASATTTLTIGGNLNASAPNITAVDPANPTAAELASPANVGSVVPTNLNVYDSIGQQHNVSLVAWKTGPTTWNYKIDPTGLGYDTTKPSTFGPGKFVFKSDGTLDTTNSTIPNITFTPSANGNAVSIKLDTSSGATALTSFVSGNSALLRDQNGFASGVLQTISIGTDGTITGAFSNGTNRTLAQVALADFNNPEGLVSTGDNLYTTSANSGLPLIGYSGGETSSTVASQELEMSNVDLAQEFTDMIVTQRGFQANAKMITTSDEMLQQLVSLKQ